MLHPPTFSPESARSYLDRNERCVVRFRLRGETWDKGRLVKVNGSGVDLIPDGASTSVHIAYANVRPWRTTGGKRAKPKTETPEAPPNSLPPRVESGTKFVIMLPHRHRFYSRLEKSFVKLLERATRFDEREVRKQMGYLTRTSKFDKDIGGDVLTEISLGGAQEAYDRWYPPPVRPPEPKDDLARAPTPQPVAPPTQPAAPEQSEMSTNHLTQDEQSIMERVAIARRDLAAARGLVFAEERKLEEAMADYDVLRLRRSLR